MGTAVQYSLWDTYSSDVVATVGSPYGVICKGLCAYSGQHLGCVTAKTQTIATACRDRNMDADIISTGQPGYWDVSWSAIFYSFIWEKY